MPNARNAKTTREKAAQLRAEAERQQARRRNVTVGIAVALLLVVLIGGYALIRTLSANQAAKKAAAEAPPANLYTAVGGTAGALYGKSTSKVTVTVYEDFLCPICKQFETADGPTLHSYADQGKIKIVYRPVDILKDRTSPAGYSTRAAAAAAIVLDASPGNFFTFHDALFANQPAEGSAGLPDSTLVDLAAKAGAPRDTVQAAVTAQKFQGWVSKGTDDFLKKYNGTPTVLIDGTQVTNLETASLVASLDKAIKAAG